MPNNEVFYSCWQVDKWKPPELTPNEMIKLKQTNVREQKMRANILNVIKRNYVNLTVEVGVPLLISMIPNCFLTNIF